MKKLLSFAIVTATLIILCSCGRLPSYEMVMSVFSKPYEASISVSDGENVYVADVTRDINGRIDFRFSESAFLYGIGYGFTEDGSYLVYNELNIPFDSASKEDKVSSGVLVWKKLLSPSGEFTVRRASSGNKTQLVLSNGTVEYVFDESTGIPQTVKTENITISFNGFKVKNDTTSESAGADKP